MFISFEGTEGVGKTTLIRKIHQYFEQQGKQVVLTREPGGTPLAEQIRSLLLAVNHEEQMSHDTELLLIYAARAQHLQQVITSSTTPSNTATAPICGLTTMQTTCASPLKIRGQASRRPNWLR